ncbi:hypothetical protein O1611_g3421 [Lasiodiplodia mahajangana]|uniref:Uncharacterized protein n=1 Tax=Lasiodiplodia mahajangana TaxID=1108764 RepID=A0ACC2JSG8_9PEZI|nr:hypothetical protein O1611_g3421 [Lasiodiplodia mahajangana]
MHKAPYVFPIIGGRTVDHLKANIEALNVSLTKEDIKEIESAAPFDLGFPGSFAYLGATPEHPGNVWLLRMGGITEYVPEQAPIVPKSGKE